MAIEVEIGALLRRARRFAGLQQIDVAGRLRIGQSHISLIERDRANPTLATLEAFAEAIGFDLLLVLVPRSPPPAGADAESVDAMIASLRATVDHFNSAIAMLRGARRPGPTSPRRRKRS